MKLIRSTFLLIGTIVTCATAQAFPPIPSQEKLNASIADYELPQLPEEGKALVYVVRSAWNVGFIPFGVYRDDKEKESKVGHMRSRQYVYFSIEPGQHKVLAKSLTWAEFEIDAKACEVIFIE
tara:strand:+ start:1312 stop:1680 length:369 start_codon:yes stop_codon:yes gene_type:complete